MLGWSTVESKNVSILNHMENHLGFGIQMIVKIKNA